MSSLRDIREKIKSVTSTQKITNAMRMMSTAKLSKALSAVTQNKVYISKLLYLARSIRARVTNFSHPALEDRQVKKSITVVIGGERGLCGGFNQDLQKFALAEVKKEPLESQQIYAIGEKPIRFFQGLNIPLAKEFHSLNVKDLEKELFELAKDLYAKFEAKETDRVKVIYTSYVSSVKHPIISQQLLPIPASSDLLADNDESEEESQEKVGRNLAFDFYPSPEELFNQILPRYMFNSLLKAITESVAAEQCARMVAMTSATDRANEKLEELRLELNRSRQAQITQELNEVIGGSQT